MGGEAFIDEMHSLPGQNANYLATLTRTHTCSHTHVAMATLLYEFTLCNLTSNYALVGRLHTNARWKCVPTYRQEKDITVNQIFKTFNFLWQSHGYPLSVDRYPLSAAAIRGPLYFYPLIPLFLQLQSLNSN